MISKTINVCRNNKNISKTTFKVLKCIGYKLKLMEMTSLKLSITGFSMKKLQTTTLRWKLLELHFLTVTKSCFT